MKITKDGKKMLAERYAEVWGDDVGMVEHCVKRASGYMMFGDDMLVMEKPGIKTDFWFGEHGYDYDEVCQRCSDARSDVDYFVGRNLDDCEPCQHIGEIDGGNHIPYLVRGYSACKGSRFAWVVWKRPSDSAEGALRKLTADEVVAFRAFCKAEVEKFERRLTSYLKRYGLSKCHYHVYWADR